MAPQAWVHSEGRPAFPAFEIWQWSLLDDFLVDTTDAVIPGIGHIDEIRVGEAYVPPLPYYLLFPESSLENFLIPRAGRDDRCTAYRPASPGYAFVTFWPLSCSTFGLEVQA